MAEPKGALNMLAQALRDPEYYKSVGRGLLDTGNRGIVAGLLGAPVDLTTMALRPLGYTVPTPIGGSEWIGNKMQQYGMVSPKRNALAEALSGFVDPATMQTGALKMAGLLGAIRDVRYPKWKKTTDTDSMSFPLGVNPTPSEMKELLRHDDSMGYLRSLEPKDGGDRYVWPINSALHQDIINHLKLDRNRYIKKEHSPELW